MGHREFWKRRREVADPRVLDDARCAWAPRAGVGVDLHWAHSRSAGARDPIPRCAARGPDIGRARTRGVLILGHARRVSRRARVHRRGDDEVLPRHAGALEQPRAAGARRAASPRDERGERHERVRASAPASIAAITSPASRSADRARLDDDRRARQRALVDLAGVGLVRADRDDGRVVGARARRRTAARARSSRSTIEVGVGDRVRRRRAPGVEPVLARAARDERARRAPRSRATTSTRSSAGATARSASTCAQACGAGAEHEQAPRVRARRGGGRRAPRPRRCAASSARCRRRSAAGASVAGSKQHVDALDPRQPAVRVAGRDRDELDAERRPATPTA